jgi:two-component system, OmpR family, alkaline phosphatase synthesis response regulator PhoP
VPGETGRRGRGEPKLRRLNCSGGQQEQHLEYSELKIDWLGRKVLRGGKPVQLTASEFEVLALLASQPGQVYSREQVMQHLYNEDFYRGARAADVHILHIRRKIEPEPKNPRYLQTERGMGYRFTNTS